MKPKDWLQQDHNCKKRSLKLNPQLFIVEDFFGRKAQSLLTLRDKNNTVQF